MFSFFKSQKKSPAVSPTQPERSEEHSQRGADDFIVIGSGQNPGGPLYPSAQLPQFPVAPVPHHSPMSRQFSIQVYNYTQNVPFKLNPVLTSDNSADAFEFKLREINQHLNQLTAGHNDYDFKLERSIVEQ